jgi:uncharacterized protein YkwD
MAVHRSGRRTFRAALALGLATVLLLGATPTGADAAERVGRRLRFVELTNEDRREHGRPALSFQRRVSRYARAHSLAMAEKGYLFHSTEEQLRRALGDVRWSIGGENVGVGSSLESLQRAFMASKLHRQNVLRRAFDHMAVGIVRQDDVIWITVIFYG